MPSSLFMALTKLDSAITSFFAHPKARRLSRELNYFKIDLQKYLRIRYSIMTLLEQHNYDYNYFVDNSKGDFMLTGDLHSNVHALQKQLKVLMDESAKLAAYVDDYPDLPQDLSEQFYITGQEQATSLSL